MGDAITRVGPRSLSVSPKQRRNRGDYNRFSTLQSSQRVRSGMAISLRPSLDSFSREGGRDDSPSLEAPLSLMLVAPDFA